MKLPIRIESHGADQPILYAGGWYYIVDAAGRTVAQVPLDGEIGCSGTVRQVRSIVKAVNRMPDLVGELRRFVDYYSKDPSLTARLGNGEAYRHYQASKALLDELAGKGA